MSLDATIDQIYSVRVKIRYFFGERKVLPRQWVGTAGDFLFDKTL